LAEQLNNEGSSGLVLEEVVERTERRWLFTMATGLGLMLAVVVFTGLTQMLNPLSDVETVNPATLHLQGEFVESNLGTAVEPDGSITVRILAEQYVFVPQCVLVPAAAPVRFRLTSPDVTHGFFVGTTNTNAMVVPGYVTNVMARFERPGTYSMPCDEFCGFGHHAMAARVVVVPKEQFKDLRPEERITTCGAQ
jgi:cytochrome c oxidase subunit II